MLALAMIPYKTRTLSLENDIESEALQATYALSEPGRCQADEREMSSSTHTLGSLNEYGKSMPRASLERGWNEPRTRLERGWNEPRASLEYITRGLSPCAIRQERNLFPSGTNSFSVGNGLRFLRYAVCVILMMVVGVSEMWGQTITNGLYYIASGGNNGTKDKIVYNSETPTTNYYLCPTENWYYYQSTSPYYLQHTDSPNNNNGMPFMTTYQCLNDNNYDSNNALWCIKKKGDTDYYYIIHVNSGKYLTYNDAYFTNTGRVRVHLEDYSAAKDDYVLYKIEYVSTFGSYDIISKYAEDNNTYKDGNRPRKYLNVNKGNRPNLVGTNADVQNSVNCGGIIGFWTYGAFFEEGSNNNDQNSRWQPKSTLLTEPTITVNAENSTFTITADFLPQGCSIRYTTGDGTQDAPTATTGEEYAVGTSIDITNFSNVKAVVVGYGMVLSNVANTMVRCATPTITYNNSTDKVTIASTEGTTIYYTTDGSTTPDPENSGGLNATQVYNSESKPTVSVTTTIKAIAVKTNLVNSLVATITIVPNPTINVTIPEGGIIYNGSEQEPTVTVMDGETSISDDEYTVSYENNKNVGTATVTITDNVGGDYIVYGSTTFTIVKAPTTVTADSKSKGYGDEDPELTFTATGLLGSDTKETAFTGALTREAGEAKGTYAISQGTLTSANYEITFVGAVFTITNKTLTITADDATKVYDGTALTKNTYTSTSLLAGDVIESVTVTGSQTNAGSSANVPSGAVIKNGSDENVTANYEITYVNGTLTVTQRPVTITADDATKVYDGTALTKNTYTSTALVSGDAIESVTVTGSQTVAGTSDNVPSAAVIKNGSSENVTNCYDITYTKGTLTVTQKALTITADDATKVYDGTALTKHTFTNTELASGDNITSVTFSGSQTVVGSSANVPSATVIKNGSNETVTASYNISYTNGTLEVTRASATVTADDGSKIYGGADPESFTATVTGLVNNESESLISYTVSRAEGENAGNYTITPIGNAEQSNYSVSYVTGTFTIAPKPLGDGTRVAEGMTITMTKEDDNYVVTVKDGETTLTKNTHYTLSEENDVVTIAGMGNYSGSARLVYATATFATQNAENGYGAVYMSAMDVLPPADVKVYVVKKVNPSIGTVNISEIDYIPEGVPVLLMADNDQTGFAASPIDEGATLISDAVRNSNKLQAAPEGGIEVADKEAYLFYRGEFVLTLAGTIGAGKFFLYNPNYGPEGGGGASARNLQWVIEDDTTGIEQSQFIIHQSLQDSETGETQIDTWFTLEGQKLNKKPSRKGIYIENGQKVIIR